MNETTWLALEIMWKGMISIFVVIIILALLICIITKFVKDPDQAPHQENGGSPNK